jgi:hypothetical protein
MDPLIISRCPIVDVELKNIYIIIKVEIDDY